MSNFIPSADEFERCVDDENIETADPIERLYLLDCNNRILYDYSKCPDVSVSDVYLDCVMFEQIDIFEGGKMNNYLVLTDDNVDKYVDCYDRVVFW